MEVKIITANGLPWRIAATDDRLFLVVKPDTVLGMGDCELVGMDHRGAWVYEEQP